MGKLEVFIEKANTVHGNRYDYSNVKYNRSTEKVNIICPIHGVFCQTPQAHLRGNGCPKCANEKRGRNRLSTQDIIDRLKKIHGNKYDYSKVEYINANTKIILTCKTHGDFSILPFSALNGSGCPKCAGKNLSKEEIIEKIKAIHGDKYDYSKVKKVNSNEKVCLICPKHGEFYITLSKIFNRGDGCKKCSAENRKKILTLTQDEVINKFVLIHNNKYDYSNVKYRSMHDKVEIICPKHGYFQQYPSDHIDGHGCPKCACIESRPENEIYEIIANYIGDRYHIIKNDRVILNGKEIDILIPEINIGIEYNGLKWHSEYAGKGKYYHLNKTISANKKGVYLLQIFEDEFITNKKLIVKKILHIIGCSNRRNKISARKCNIKEINKKEAHQFLNENHIQGYSRCSFSYGCFYDGYLIGVMSFLDNGNNNYELVRFATHNNYICNGVGGKIFKYFITEKRPNKVKSFADRRWTINQDNNLYTKLGFKLDKILPPDYSYISINNPLKRIHKFNFRKKILNKKYGLDLNMSETDMVKSIGYTKIWNCGLFKYVWKKEG